MKSNMHLYVFNFYLNNQKNICQQANHGQLIETLGQYIDNHVWIDKVRGETL
jgi:hypothetical protein